MSVTENADVIPLQVSGTVDTDLTKLTAKEIMLHGLANVWKEGREGGYTVRHGAPVRDHPPDGRGSPLAENYFEKAFPCLFPYGCGGIEGNQEVPIDFRSHVRWVLGYFDRRFRQHETFPFVAFAIAQRREVLGAARL
jgi:hypothetical protein